MRALAMTGIVTASWVPLMRIGSDMRATPPSRRMSAGTRSSAMTAAAPASSAILACSALTTSMITPPLSISASPALTRNVDSSRIPEILLRRLEHLGGDAHAGEDRPVEVSLVVLGRVLAAEVAVAVGDVRLGRAEGAVLAGLVVRVGALGPSVAGPEVDRGLAVIGLGDAGQHGLELAQERPGARVRGAGAERVPDPAARVVDQDSLRARLGAGHLPRRLVARVGVGVAVIAQRAPLARLEADVQLRARPHPELADGARLERAEAGLRVVHGRSQDREGQREHEPVRGFRVRRRAVREGQRVAAVAAAHDRDELAVAGDLARELRGEPRGDLLVAPAHVYFSLDGPKRRSLPCPL